MLLGVSATRSLCLAANTIPSFPDPSDSASSTIIRDAYNWPLRSKCSSMNAKQTYGAYSAQVKMELLINGDALEISQMGPDFLLMSCAREFSPCEATIVLRV